MDVKFLEGEFQRIRVGKDDTIVISSPMHLTSEQFKVVGKQAQRAFPERKILILDGGLKLGVTTTK